MFRPHFQRIKRTKIARTIHAIFVRPWPLTVLVIWFCVHKTCTDLFPAYHRELINTLFSSSSSQLIGISVIIYSLISSLKLLSGKDILEIIKGWANSIYEIWNNKQIESKINGTLEGVTGNFFLQATKQNATIEDKIKELEEKYNNLALTVQNNYSLLNKSIKNLRKQTEESLHLQKEWTNSQIRASVLGNLSSHIFGILITAYGISVPIWA